MQWKDIGSASDKEDFEEIIVTNGEIVCSAVLFEGRWLDHFHDFVDPAPTHWIPLPPPPESAENK